MCSLFVAHQIVHGVADSEPTTRGANTHTHKKKVRMIK